MTHIYVNKLTIIGSSNGLSPDRRQAIIWNKWGIINWNLRIKLRWNLKQNSYTFSQETAFENVVRKMAAIKCVFVKLFLVFLVIFYQYTSRLHY